MSNMTIKMIPLNKLYHNPKNPRQQIGDITELADSIKTMGFLQNLAVIPYDPAEHAGLTVADPQDAYVVLIGNRRLDAGIAAGVAEAPCYVLEPGSDEMSIMLVENCLREGLSPREQALGIQLMLDMGDSVESVAQKTGFSVTTVRTRTKLLELDADKFAQADQRGATLMDYAMLNKLKTVEMKNQVLESIGTNNFANALKQAMDQEKQNNYMENVRACLRGFAKEITRDDIAGLKSVTGYGMTYGRGKKVEIPDDLDTVKYYFIDGSYNIYLYREKLPGEDVEDPAITQGRMEYDRKKANLKAATERAYELRLDFVKGLAYSQAKKNIGLIAAYTVKEFFRLEGYHSINIQPKLMAEILGIPYDMDSHSIDEKKLEALRKTQPELVLFVTAYLLSESASAKFYHEIYSSTYKTSVAFYHNSEALDRVYALLCAMGYTMSDEEKQLQDGNHPDFSEEIDAQTVA